MFWIGIGHAGTLISAILFLFRAKWRNAINRGAEAMTVFAVLTAALFPLIHIGRLWKFYFLIPYPNQRALWVNFKSPLLWDVFAINTYMLISIIFFFVGLIPDIAIARDRATGIKKFVYTLLSGGWQGTGRQWKAHNRTVLHLAGLATPLVLSVHSVVSWDFAMSIVPGWHATIFAPYFVAGAIFGGFAMVVVVMIPVRRIFRLEPYITDYHFENMSRFILFTSLICGYAYAAEYFIAWYSGVDFEQTSLLAARLRSLLDLDLDHDLVQRDLPAAALDQEAPDERPLPLRALRVHQHRHVVRALRHHHHVALAGVRDGRLGPLHPEPGRALDPRGLVLLVQHVLPALPEVPPDHRHRRDEGASDPRKGARGRGRARGGPLMPTLVSVFDMPDDTATAIRKLRGRGFDQIESYSPAPFEQIDEAMDDRPSKVRAFTLVGGLTGVVTGFAMQIWMSLEWPIKIAGKAYASIPPYVIIGFELTILFGGVLTLVGLFLVGRLYPRPLDAAYSPRFSAEEFGVAVTVSDRDVAEVDALLRSLSAKEVTLLDE